MMTDQDVQETYLSVFRRIAKERYDNSGGNTIVTLKPSTESLASLGVPAQISSASSLISPDSAYGKLPRLAILPRCTYSAKNEDAQKAALKLWNGDFVVEYHESEDGLKMSAGMLRDDEDVAEEFRGLLIYIALTFGENEEGTDLEIKMTSNTIAHVSGFGAALYEKHTDALVCRVLHQFIRHHGYMLKWSIVNVAVIWLVSKYKSKKCLETKLDAYMIEADLMHNLPGHGLKETGLALVKVGELLEALARFQEAGDLYQETAENYVVNTPLDWQVYGFAGLAYKRAKEYVEAEKGYVKALHHCCQRSNGNWDLNDDGSTNLFTNLLMLHAELTNKRRVQGGGHLHLGKVKEKCNFALLGLLFCSGFKARCGGLSEKMVMQDGCTCMGLLSSQCKTQKGAKEALINAVKSGTLEGFRKGMLAAFDSRTIIGIVPGKGGVKEQNEAAARKDNAQSARRLIRKNEDGMRSMAVCTKCEKLEGKGENFMRCPCHSVYYCRRSCQVDDWKEHKKVCSYHADKKKSRKAK